MVAMKEMDEQTDYMIVPDVIGVRKNGKIRQMRNRYGIYHIYHPVTKTQNKLLNVFGEGAK